MRFIITFHPTNLHEAKFRVDQILQMSDVSISCVVIPRYYTDETVQSGESCDARVAAERERIRAANSTSLGVIPTVSLGSAMLIFALVGTFAAGIAQGWIL